MEDNVWIIDASFVVITSPSCYPSVRKKNTNQVKLLSGKDKMRIMIPLIKVTLQALARELAALLKRSFSLRTFSRNFQSNYSYELLWVLSVERLHRKGSLSKTRRASKEEKEKFLDTLKNESSEWNLKIIEKMTMPEPFFSNITLWLKTKLHHGHFLRNALILFWDRLFIRQV